MAGAPLSELYPLDEYLGDVGVSLKKPCFWPLPAEGLLASTGSVTERLGFGGGPKLFGFLGPRRWLSFPEVILPFKPEALIWTTFCATFGGGGAERLGISCSLFIFSLELLLFTEGEVSKPLVG